MRIDPVIERQRRQNTVMQWTWVLCGLGGLTLIGTGEAVGFMLLAVALIVGYIRKWN